MSFWVGGGCCTGTTWVYYGMIGLQHLLLLPTHFPLPLQEIPLDTLTAPPTCATPHNYRAPLSLSLFIFCCQQVASSATSSLSGTGLFFLRCQNPTIHSHRVASHPAPKGWTPPKNTNLGISHFRFFLFHRFFPLWSILQHLQCQKRPKAPTFSSGAYH